MATSRVVPPLHANLLRRMEDARARTDALFELLPLNTLYDRPIPERHRLIFYVGHLEAFDANLLKPALGLESRDPAFDALFAFGIDPVSGDLPTDTPRDWPSIEQVKKYNRDVRDRIDAVLSDSRALHSSNSELADGTLLQVAIEHRLMHAETLAYLLHNLPTDRTWPLGSARPDPRPAPSPRRVTIPAGIATLGLARGAAFGWDNEFEAYKVEVPTFSIDAFPVTNGEYMRFIDSGGYEESRYWTPESWKWKSGARLEHPHFWSRRTASSGEAQDGWEYRAMFGRIPLPLSWPVYVSQAEASAYACWAGKQLPSEAEWHRAAYGAPNGTESNYPWGDAPPHRTHGNFHFESWDATAVDAHPAGASAFGVLDLLGNGWELTRTPFSPFPGFRAFSFYPGYSANFFDDKHYVLKGGSAQTDVCMLRRPFRNWFQPHYTYVYATFRCVEE